MQEKLRIGLIVKPQGVWGQLKILPLTDDVSRFKKLKEVIIDGNFYKINGVKCSLDAVFLALDGINTRNDAEKYRNKYVEIDRVDAVTLKSDRYFIADIVGCELFDETQKIADIIDVTSAHTDFITAKCVDGRIVRFPFLKDSLINVDIDNNKMIVKSERFKEIACYED